jgi:hypothetical protein
MSTWDALSVICLSLKNGARCEKKEAAEGKKRASPGAHASRQNGLALSLPWSSVAHELLSVLKSAPKKTEPPLVSNVV